MLGLFNKRNKEDLDKGLEKTKQSILSRLSRAITGKSSVDQSVLDQLEEILIESDVGVDTTLKIIGNLEKIVREKKYVSTEELNEHLVRSAETLLSGNRNESVSYDFTLSNAPSPYVVMVVGVNGVGKTTTIGKLAHQYKKAGKNVLLGAADTFRAAASDQLKIWAERVDVPIVAQGMGADPASVAFDTLSSAKARSSDVVIIDTAGRLHNKSHLMDELSKIKRVMEKVIPGAPHEIILVLDASTGQNAIEQARKFLEATSVNSLALTKLDGTAKGGIVLAVSDLFKIPVKYLGVGEGVNDLQLFKPDEFVKSLFGLSG